MAHYISMHPVFKVLALIIIASGLYLGVRYIGSVIHYACQVPLEDCPPPFKSLGDLSFYITGGELVPFWRQS